MTVLEMARGKSECVAIASLHRTWQTRKPAAPHSIKSKLLVCTGAGNPLVPFDHMAASQEEMRHSVADCQTIIYSGARHGFATTFASKNPGIAYHPDAVRRSWAAMRTHCDEAFGPRS